MLLTRSQVKVCQCPSKWAHEPAIRILVTRIARVKRSQQASTDGLGGIYFLIGANGLVHFEYESKMKSLLVNYSRNFNQHEVENFLFHQCCVFSSDFSICYSTCACLGLEPDRARCKVREMSLQICEKAFR